jgi:hypothetical protein
VVNKLQKEIASIPINQRFYTGVGMRLLDYYCENACVFGYGTYDNTIAIHDIPDETKGLYFYYGAGIKDLLQEILKLPIIKNLECLAIGITHNNTKDYADYSEISRLLSNTYLPKLRFFEYGVDELTVNDHRIFGNLGNITEVLQNMPRLEKLYLHGNFQLTKSLNLPHLTDLETVMNDFSLNINSGKITNTTLQLLLSSKFEALRLMSLYLDINDTSYDYSISEDFLSGRYTPTLKILELEGKFKAGTRLAIENSAFLQKQTKVLTDGIDEPNN